MNIYQVYEQAVKPLSSQEKLSLARLILDDIDGQTGPPETGFDALKRVLPQIERITLTDHDLAAVSLNGPEPE